MTPQTEYMIQESRWLLSFGRHPLDVAEALHRHPSTLYKMAERHGLTDIHDAFKPYAKRWSQK